MEKMEKKVVRDYAGNTLYLIGKDHDGNYWYLEEPSWDCDWYWGLGYLEVYKQNKVKVPGCHWIHTHIDSHFFSNRESTKPFFEIFEDEFAASTLDNKAMWKFFEYAQTLYTLKKMSGLVHLGDSHITEAPYVNIKDDELYKRINQEMIPSVFKSMYELLIPDGSTFEIPKCGL